jgi:Prokaryotic lipoprotein-attachment site
MLTRIVLAWAPAVLSLMLVACGSKGDLVLPKAPAPPPAVPSAAPAAPAVPSPAKQP